MKTIASLFLSLLLVSCSAAQASSNQTGAATSAQPATAAPQAGTDSPKPAPEMERLIKMWVGRWTTVEQFEPSDEAPQGKLDKGAETMRPGPGGLSLIGDYESHGAFFGHLVVTWIPQERAYKSLWLDRTQPGVSFSTGRWDGEKLVFAGADESTGKKLLIRDTYSDITPTSFTDVLETGPVGGPMKKILTVKYTKQHDGTSQKDPCDKPMSQMESNSCYAEQYREDDKHLNALYKKLVASMEKDLEGAKERGFPQEIKFSEQQIEKLKAAELAWINYRDLDCAAARHQTEPGTISPMRWSICMSTLTNRRIDEMKLAYEIGDFKLQ